MAAIVAAERVLREAAASGLALDRLPANPAKLRLMLDLAAQLHAAPGPARVLDVGAGGRNEPFNLWEPFLPLADRIELVGVDVAHLDRTRSHADAIGFPVTLLHAGVDGIEAQFGAESFDAVVSTQVLEHLPQWPAAIEAMSRVLRSGGRLYATCDSGDLALGAAGTARLAGKRAYARLADKVPAAGKVLGSRLSGEWERGPTRLALEECVHGLSLEQELLRHYGIRDMKALQRFTGAGGRLLWLAYEEALAPDVDPSLFKLLYLRARRP